MRHVTGERVLTSRGDHAIGRRSQYLPRHGERRYLIARGSRWWRVHWVAHGGYRVVGYGEVGLPQSSYHEIDCHPQKGTRVKRRVAPSDGASVPALSVDSKTLLKFPNIREFLSATKYDDDTPRQPGYLTIRNRVASYEVTLYDPDAGLRCAARANTLDDVLAAAELLLGAPEAPWEVDQYLQSQLSRGKKKRA